jgi:hypothetical protein
MEYIKIDSLSLDFIKDDLNKDTKNSLIDEDILNAIEKMLRDCDNDLIELITKYL